MSGFSTDLIQVSLNEPHHNMVQPSQLLSHDPPLPRQWAQHQQNFRLHFGSKTRQHQLQRKHNQESLKEWRSLHDREKNFLSVCDRLPDLLNSITTRQRTNTTIQKHYIGCAPTQPRGRKSNKKFTHHKLETVFALFYLLRARLITLNHAGQSRLYWTKERHSRKFSRSSHI